MKLITPIISVAIILAFCGTSQAQWTLKPTAGINWSGTSSNPENGEASANVGYQFGASALFGRKLYGEIGAYYQQTTTEYTSENVTELNFDKKIKSVRVPLSVGFHILGDRESDVNLRAFGGASGLFVTGVSGGDLDKDQIESPQWGVHAGAGVDLWLFFLDLKYQWSLTDITSITDFNVGKSRTFFVNAGVRLRL